MIFVFMAFVIWVLMKSVSDDNTENYPILTERIMNLIVVETNMMISTYIY
jgi:hypothetical protein